MKQVKQQTLMSKSRQETIAKAQEGHAQQWARNRRRSSKVEEPSMELPQLLAEMAAIWATLSNQNDKSDAPRVINGRVPAHQVLQACIKTFYLRKSGRSKFVEA